MWREKKDNGMRVTSRASRVAHFNAWRASYTRTLQRRRNGDETATKRSKKTVTTSNRVEQRSTEKNLTARQLCFTKQKPKKDISKYQFYTRKLLPFFQQDFRFLDKKLGCSGSGRFQCSLADACLLLDSSRGFPRPGLSRLLAYD